MAYIRVYRCSIPVDETLHNTGRAHFQMRHHLNTVQLQPAAEMTVDTLSRAVATHVQMLCLFTPMKLQATLEFAIDNLTLWKLVARR